MNAIYDLILESQRRCSLVRVRRVRGEITDTEALTEYAIATAPLASAARLIERESVA